MSHLQIMSAGQYTAFRIFKFGRGGGGVATLENVVAIVHKRLNRNFYSVIKGYKLH